MSNEKIREIFHRKSEHIAPHEGFSNDAYLSLENFTDLFSEHQARIEDLLYQDNIRNKAISDLVETNRHQLDRIEELETEIARRHGIGGELTLARKERDELQSRLSTVKEGLADMIALASGLNEDDPWFGERRDADIRIEKANAILKELQ